MRQTYLHVGPPGPTFGLRDLTDDERARTEGSGYVKFEPYPVGHKVATTGRYWTQDQIDKVGRGCGVRTSMPIACAETFAAQPGYYHSTFCCGCNEYRPVGADGEFIWDDGTGQRVGT